MRTEIPGTEIRSVRRGNGPWKDTLCVVCSGCPATLPIHSRSKNGPTPASIETAAREAGWRWSQAGAHLCPNCLAKDEPVDAPREMGPDQRRRVFRAVDGNWDEKNRRYIGEATDVSLAAELKVPRAWVAQVRTEAFGEERNEHDLKRREKLIALSRQCAEAIETCLTAASAAEEAQRSVEAALGNKGEGAPCRTRT